MKMAKPMRLDGIDMMDTHPVWSPKYMFAKHITVPIARPTTTPRTVKLCPGGDGGAMTGVYAVTPALSGTAGTRSKDMVRSVFVLRRVLCWTVGGVGVRKSRSSPIIIPLAAELYH